MCTTMPGSKCIRSPAVVSVVAVCLLVGLAITYSDHLMPSTVPVARDGGKWFGVVKIPLMPDLARISSGFLSQMTEDVDEFADAVAGQEKLPYCPEPKKEVLGPVSINETVLTWSEAERNVGANVIVGGRRVPQDCRARSRVAILVAYRNREANLVRFLNHMHPFLGRQKHLTYAIYVVNQAKDGMDFNRGLLFNAGFKEALRDYADWDCFVFHDVDLLPEDDRNLYDCPMDQPRHLGVALSQHAYKPFYETFFGAVSSMSGKHFRLINGFSNQFWGWGGEDDDLWNRVAAAGLKVSRYPEKIARYRSLGHKEEDKNPARFKLVDHGSKRFKSDGLNNLNYTLVDVRREKLYTLVNVTLFKL